jgi:hypothetical protein
MSKNVKRIIVSLNALLLLTGVGASNLASAQETRNINSIEIVAIASITPDKVECWDVSGKRNELLSKEIYSYCQSVSTRRFKFTIGRKTRYIVYRGNAYTWLVDGEPRKTDEYLTQGHSFNGLGMVPIVVDAQASRATLLTYNTDTKEQIDYLECRSGSQATADGTTYKVLKISSFSLPRSGPKPIASMNLSSGQQWKILLDVSANTEGQMLMNGYGVFNKDKKQIPYVDTLGMPVSAVTYLTDPESDPETDPSTQDVKQHKYSKAYVKWWITDKEKYLVTNVNPDILRYIGFRHYTRNTFRFEHVAMDPKE